MGGYTIWVGTRYVVCVCDTNVTVMVAIRNDTTSYIIFLLHSVVLPTKTHDCYFF
jgi:hypothetical protein